LGVKSYGTIYSSVQTNVTQRITENVNIDSKWFSFTELTARGISDTLC